MLSSNPVLNSLTKLDTEFLSEARSCVPLINYNSLGVAWPKVDVNVEERIVIFIFILEHIVFLLLSI
jgi:hypothetical protein